MVDFLLGIKFHKLETQTPTIERKTERKSHITRTRKQEEVKHTSVPKANFSNSKTPIGPFQITVFVVSNTSLNFLIESGPMSKPIHPSGIAEAGTTYKKVTPYKFCIKASADYIHYSERNDSIL
jgi:hypothetical protein